MHGAYRQSDIPLRAGCFWLNWACPHVRTSVHVCVCVCVVLFHAWGRRRQLGASHRGTASIAPDVGPPETWQGLESHGAADCNPQFWRRKSQFAPPGWVVPRCCWSTDAPAARPWSVFRLPVTLHCPDGPSSQPSGFLAPSTKPWVEKEGRRRGPAHSSKRESVGRGTGSSLSHRGPLRALSGT